MRAFSLVLAFCFVSAVLASNLAHSVYDADLEASRYFPEGHPEARPGQLKAGTHATWSYDRLADNGPQHWGHIVTACAGSNQSPVDVTTGSVKYDSTLAALNFNYAPRVRTVVNNGHSLQINEVTGNNTDQLSGGALNGGLFNFVQAHVHLNGEHTVNGGAFPLEIHLVHSNTDLTQVTPEPTAKELTVVGLLFKEGAEHAGLKAFVDAVSVEGFNHVDSTASATIDLNALLPATRSYYTYPGSLTTPNCRETVTWHVLQVVQEASPAQIEHLRVSLPEPNNYRPVQAVGTRVIRSNVPVATGSSINGAAANSANIVAIMMLAAVTIAYQLFNKA